MAVRGRLSEQAYETVKQRLLDGDYKMGESISVELLVGELGASRQPVMDALKRLATEGFLDIIPQVGVRVVSPSAQEIRDFFRLFAATEGLCAAMAAERADATGAAGLASINSQIGLLRTSDDDAETIARRYRSLNREFHGALHALANSQTVAATAKSLWDRSDFYIGTAMGTHLFSQRLHEAHEEHELICQAVADNNPAAARTAMEDHVLNFGHASEGR